MWQEETAEPEKLRQHQKVLPTVQVWRYEEGRGWVWGRGTSLHMLAEDADIPPIDETHRMERWEQGTSSSKQV